MIKKATIILILVSLSLVINQNSVSCDTNPKMIPISFNLVEINQIDLGDEVYVEFNDTMLPDNQVFGVGDTVWFSFFYDVAEFRLTADVNWSWSQANNWYFDEEDQYGVYQETRFLGILNVYIDDKDFGLSNIETFGDSVNTTQRILDTVLTKGWHLITVFAAEYVSDPTRTTMYWQSSKDEKWFYVSEEATDIAPSRVETQAKVTVKANPITHEEWVPPFDWNFIYIWPRTDKTANTKYETTLTQEGQEAHIETLYNVSMNTMVLNETNISGSLLAVFEDSDHMGEGTVFWWTNDGPVTSDLQANFELNRGENFVYFAVVGLRTYELAMLAYNEPIPRADVSSEEFTVINNIPIDESPFSFDGFVIGLSFLATISLLVKVWKKK